MSFRIMHRPAACRGCALDSIADAFSDPEGLCTNGVMLVGESLDYYGAEQGYPFRPHSPSGSVLDRAIRSIGVTREGFGLWNMVGCKPPSGELNGADWERGAIDHCKVHFRRVVSKFRPKVIVALGAVPLRSLTGMSGECQTLDYLRGYVLWNEEFKCHVVATYHPTFIVKGMWPLFQVLCRDLRKALDVSKNGIKTPNLRYTEYGTEHNLRAMYDELVSDPQIPVSVDIETDYLIQAEKAAEDGDGEILPPTEQAKQDITQINLSLGEEEGLVCSILPVHMRLFKAICELPNPKIGQNHWLFDKPVLVQHGIALNGDMLDTMWAAHHVYPDLPGKRGKMSNSGTESDDDGSVMNLQYIASFADFPFPWKHLSSERPEWYGCCDVDSAIRAWWWLQAQMDHMGLTAGYYALVQDMMPVLDGMRRRGIPVTRNTLIDLHNYLSGEIEEVTARIQTYVPKSLLPTKPLMGYKKTPKVTDGMVQKEFVIEGGRVNCKCWKIRKKNLEYYAQSEYAQMDDKGRLRAPDPECPICGGSGSLQIETHTEVRWCKTQPFKVSSPKQMFAYAYHRKHDVPKNSKKKYAMDSETVEKLAKKYNDPLYTDCVKSRKLTKMDSTYATGWLNACDAAGFVHSSIAFFPATQQLSSRKPNTQNQPNVQKQGKLAEMFASAIEAKDGYSLVPFDWKSFHAQTLGFEAQDLSYIRLAKIDIHSYLATWMLKIPHCEVALTWTDQELKDWLTWYKKNYHLKDGTEFKTIRDKQAKPGILGYGFGLGAEKLYKLNEDSFNNLLEAEQVLKTLDATFPKVAKFRQVIPLVAKKQGGYLKTLYGSIRWFWDIQAYNFRFKKYVHGGDWEKCIAYKPAASAFGHCKQTMVMLDNFDHMGNVVPAIDAMNERYGLSNQVHDELFFHCPNHLVEECLHIVKPYMERKSDTLIMDWEGASGEGLAVEVEAKVGKNRASLKEVTV